MNSALVSVRWFLAGTVLSVAVVAPLFAELPSAQGSTAYRELLTWKRNDDSATGIVYFQSSDKGLVRRLLVETPGGRRLVLTKRLLAQKGEDRYELLDEESGWWFRLVKDFDVEAETLAEFFSQAEELLQPGGSREVSIELMSSNGLSFAATVPIAKQGAVEEGAFAGRLLDSDVAAPLKNNVPEGLERGIAFLDEVFEPRFSDSRALLEVLAQLLDATEDESGAGGSWQQAETRRRPGLGPETTEEARFLSRFLSIDPAEPLK